MIGTIVERTTGYATLVHLPREQGWRAQPITKTGPALSGYGAISMNKALTQALASMPAELKRSLTWGRGKEMSAHAQFAIDTGLKVYFATAQSVATRHSREHEWTTGLVPESWTPYSNLMRWLIFERDTRPG